MPDFSFIVIATNEQKQHLTKSLMQSIFIFFPFHLHNPIFLSLSPPFSPSVYILCLFSLTESIFNYFSYSYLLDSIPIFFFSLPLLLRQVCLSVHLCFSLSTSSFPSFHSSHGPGEHLKHGKDLNNLNRLQRIIALTSRYKEVPLA